MQAPSSLTSLRIAPRTVQEHPEWSEHWQGPPPMANLLQSISSLRSLSCTVRASVPCLSLILHLIDYSLHAWHYHWGMCTIVDRLHTCIGTCKTLACVTLVVAD